MIFKDYTIPETQKEKFALAVKLAKDFNEKYIVFNNSPRIRTKNYLPVEGGVEKIAAFFEGAGPEATLIFLRFAGPETGVKLINMPEINDTELIHGIMDKVKNDNPAVSGNYEHTVTKIIKAKEITDDGEIVPWEKE